MNALPSLFTGLNSSGDFLAPEVRASAPDIGRPEPRYPPAGLAERPADKSVTATLEERSGARGGGARGAANFLR